MYPQGVCRIRKPACAGNGCAIFPTSRNAVWEQKIRCPAADDLFRVSRSNYQSESQSVSPESQESPESQLKSLSELLPESFSLGAS